MFVLFLFLFIAGHTKFADGQHYRKTDRILSKALVREHNRVYACSGWYIYAFESNGSIAWRQQLRYSCNSDIGPIDGGTNNIYIISGTKVLKIDLVKAERSESATEVFFDAVPDYYDDPAEIVGLAAGMSLSDVFINVKPRGLFAFSSDKQPLWSTGPMLSQYVYRQGCKNNASDCHFVSAPVLDLCEASVYISNNQGQLYSISAMSPNFNWIQDLSSYGINFAVTAGNNGLLYVTFSSKSLLLALDVFNGSIIWEKTIGPMINSASPVVDSNGWVSIGSLDGALYSFSPTGSLKKFPRKDDLDSIIQVNPISDCSGFAVYVDQTIMEKKHNHTTSEYNYISTLNAKAVKLTILEPATGFIHWSGTYPDDTNDFISSYDLAHFLLDEKMLIAFATAANIGNQLPCRIQGEKTTSTCSQGKRKTTGVYTVNEKGIKLFLLFESVLLGILTALVRFCFVFWNKKKVQSQNLNDFLKKRRSLQLEKKKITRAIAEVEQKAMGASEMNIVLEQLSYLVHEKERVERKLSTSYSLGGDSASKPNTKMKSLLPSHSRKSNGYSFWASKEENVTIFSTQSDTSETDSSSNWAEDSRDFHKDDDDVDLEEHELTLATRE